MFKAWVLGLSASACLFAAVDFDTLSDNAWVQQATSGQGPASGGDVLWACDTAGYAYMFGGCTYGTYAGGSHNNDIYRFDLRTGSVTHLASCSNNVWGWKGGCQAGQVYDITRNSVWFCGGAAATCGSGQLGLWRFQCPAGPAVRVGDANAVYIKYDPINDLIYKPDQYGLDVYDCKTSTWRPESQYPFYIGGSVDGWAIPCLFDAKRRLFVMTMLNPAYGNERTDVYCYNPATNQWHTKVPPAKPGMTQAEMEYDPLNDKYVYFKAGPDGCTSEVWIYDYDANTWTQMPRNGRSYNDADRAASTWPPARHEHTWAYSPKYRVFATWGGGQWISDPLCTDYDNGAQPIWYYRLQNNPTKLRERPSIRKEIFLSASPNPFHGAVTLRYVLPARGHSAKLAVYDLRGRRRAGFTPRAGGGTAIWEAGQAAPGLYTALLSTGGHRVECKLMIVR